MHAREGLHCVYAVPCFHAILPEVGAQGKVIYRAHVHSIFQPLCISRERHTRISSARYHGTLLILNRNGSSENRIARSVAFPTPWRTSPLYLY